MEILLRQVAAIDTQVFLYFNGHHNAVMDLIMPVITLLGDGTAMIVLWLVYFGLADRRAGVSPQIWAAACANNLLICAVKVYFNRPRPASVLPDVHVLGPLLQYRSFPSGHTGAAFAVAIVLAHHYPRYKWIFYSLAVLVGYSRMYVGAHFPVDVTVGALLGVLTGKAVIWWGCRKKEVITQNVLENN